MKKFKTSIVLILCIIFLISTFVFAQDTIEDSNVLSIIEFELNSGAIESYKVYKSPFVEDTEQIKGTLEYLYQDRTDIKKILTINGEDIGNTEFKNFTGIISERDLSDSEGNYVKEEDKEDIVKRDDNNNILPSTGHERKKATIVIDGKVLHTDVDAYVEKGRTMVPFRAIAEALGSEVGYSFRNPEVRVIWAIRAHDKIDMMIGDNRIFKNGKQIFMDATPILESSRTLIPARYISELLDAKVDWCQDTLTVTITTRGYTGEVRR